MKSLNQDEENAGEDVEEVSRPEKSTLKNSLNQDQENAGEAMEAVMRLDKIDRLSFLPNELLDHIFDLAYPIDTPSTGPLSKHLLPFHITGIYRRIRISRPASLRMLVSRINSRPELGASVVDLLIGETNKGDLRATLPAVTELCRFFRNLLRLEVFIDRGSIRCLLDYLNESDIDLRRLLPKVRQIETACFCENRFLTTFTLFTTLTNLSILDYDDDLSEDFSSSPALPSLSSLRIEGQTANHSSVAKFCQLCPSLSDLSLSCDTPSYHLLLSLLPTTLTVLRLENPHSEQDVVSCEQHLARFVNLRRLYLGDFLHTRSIGQHLVGLTKLEVLGLDRGTVDADKFKTLFEGPARLPSLQHIDLDLDWGCIGTRLEIDDDGTPSIDDLVAGEGLPAPNWMLPDHYGNVYEIDEAIGVAEENGITVEGTVKDAIKTVYAYELELANLAIYQAWLTRDLGRLQRKRYASMARPCSRFPSIDINPLDPKNLRLVKTYLNEGWFSLTLENGGGFELRKGEAE